MPEESQPDVLVKRFDSELPMPEYKTPGAAAFDLYVRQETVLTPKTVTMVPLNIALKVPKGHVTLLFARSSLQKKGLMVANSVGVIDEDYCGDNDEFIAALYNFSDQPVTLPKAERIMQAMIVPVEHYTFMAVDSMMDETRGGFGSTGTN